MSNLIPLEDAARILGLPVDKLNEMRSNSEIFGYKDGTSWKFKMQELERVADELDITINVGASPVSESEADIDDDDAFELSVDDEELSFELSDSSADFLRDDDSGDLRLEGDDNAGLPSDDDALDLDDDPDGANSDELSFGSSDIHLAADDDASAVDLLDDDEPSRGDPSTGKILADEDDDDMLLSEDDLFEDELTIQESHEDSADLSSDFDDSSDIIMDDSDSSAEVDVLVAADDDDSAEFEMSKSSLMDLADEDDDEMIVLDDPADPDDPTQLRDDDFNLTPLEAAADDDESSGSQIIALEDSELYSDESAATLLSPSDEIEAEPMLTDDVLDVGDFGGFDIGVPGMAPGVGGFPGASQSLPEEPYSVWQIVSLGLVLFLLLIGGMIGYDLARNLWLPEDQLVSGGVLKFILSLVGM